jgi:signal transduction histidine kinase
MQQAEESFLHDSSAFLVATHELKAPLALVRQLSLLLESGQVGMEDQQRMLRQITLTSERALRLTTDLTRTARLQDALFELEPVNAQQLCEDIVHELSPLFSAHGRTIQAVRRRRQTLMVANRDLLRRIVLNFSDNALHYANTAGKVELQAQSLPGDVVRIGVRDYGPALSVDAWRDITSHLHRPQAVHARPQSSGLGLYIASQFADAMHGKIGAIRHRDGATFYVDMTASTQLSLL